MVLIRSIAQAIGPDSTLPTQYEAIIRDYIRRSSPAAGSQARSCGTIQARLASGRNVRFGQGDTATNPRDVSIAPNSGRKMDMLTRSHQDTCGAPLLFPTDLSSFLDLIRQHGDAAYSIMFAYAASHSLLLALFAGYAAHSGALQLATLIMVCWSAASPAMWSAFGSGGVMAPACLGPFQHLIAPCRSQPGWLTVITS
jgi:hypothetical protein